MSLLFQCNNIRKEFGTHNVLKSITFDIEEGERAGLVGFNGAGKSTLANIIYGDLKPDGGSINWHRCNVGIGYLRQSVFYKSAVLQKLFRDNEDATKLQNFLYTTSQLGAEKIYTWEDERFDALSGGERTKLALSQIWAEEPDLIILDEPTNHLDFKGVGWLIGKLKEYKGTIIVISHDRYFLDNTVNRVLEIDDGVINDYRGNYTAYRNEKKRRYDARLHAYETQERYKDKIEEQIGKLSNWSNKAHRDSTKIDNSGNKFGTKEYFRVKAKKMDKQVKSKTKRLEKIDTDGVQKPKDEFKLSFEFNDAENRGKRIINASNVSKSFGSRVLFKDSNFYVQRGERIGILGENGCGKTTLIRAFMGQGSLDGKLFISPSIKIGYMSQDVHDLDSEKRALDLFNIPNNREQGKVRTLLANMGINSLLLDKPVNKLSLGERTKLKLANLLISDYELLILDEPTNHLDLHALEELEESLSLYKGTILLATHDRYMMERICNRLLVFENGRINRLEYGIKEYTRRKEHSRQSSSVSGEEKKVQEEKMVLENQITTVLSKLSLAKPDTEEYAALDSKFKELVEKKKSFSSHN